MQALHLLIIVWLLIVPIGLGAMPAMYMGRDTFGAKAIQSFVVGFFVMLGLFEIIATVCVVAGGSLTLLTILAASILGSLSLTGWIFFLVRLSKKGRSPFEEARGGVDTVTVVFMILSFVMIGVQIFLAVFFETANADDAKYLADAMAAVEQDVLYRIDPYSGYPCELNARYALSAFPLFYAYLSRISGLHAAIIAHTVWPAVMLILVYAVHYQVGLLLTGKKYASLYLFFITILNLFGGASLYESETYLMTRTWQGKAILSSLVIPAIFWLLLYTARLYDTNEKKSYSITYDVGERRNYRLHVLSAAAVIAMVALSGVFASAMSLLLVPLLLVVGSVGLSIYLRKPLLWLNMCVIPGVFYAGYAVLYLLIR